MPDFLAKQLEHKSGIFRNNNEILFTHLHPDHFDRTGLEHLKKGSSHPLIYGPGLPDSNIREEVLNTNIHQLVLPSGNVLTKNTMHDGEKWKKDLHQSFLVQRYNETWFVAGDADLTEKDAKEFLPFIKENLQGGFFNLYQLCSEQCRAFIRALPFERIFLYHLPFKQDDQYNYAKLARQIARNTPEGLPEIEILSHMTWIDQKQPKWNDTAVDRRTDTDSMHRATAAGQK